ncbi:MAG: hypothetical protein KDJ90_12660 [Nitratireductor sp.]|nr:hypothetical protein [Nitratireductor sp.]
MKWEDMTHEQRQRYYEGEFDPRYPDDGCFWCRLALLILAAAVVVAVSIRASRASVPEDDGCISHRAVATLLTMNMPTAARRTYSGQFNHEVWVADGGVWAIVRVDADGCAAIVDEGRGWSEIVPLPVSVPEE